MDRAQDNQDTVSCCILTLCRHNSSAMSWASMSIQGSALHTVPRLTQLSSLSDSMHALIVIRYAGLLYVSLQAARHAQYIRRHCTRDEQPQQVFYPECSLSLQTVKLWSHHQFAVRDLNRQTDLQAFKWGFTRQKRSHSLAIWLKWNCLDLYWHPAGWSFWRFIILFANLLCANLHAATVRNPRYHKQLFCLTITYKFTQ